MNMFRMDWLIILYRYSRFPDDVTGPNRLKRRPGLFQNESQLGVYRNTKCNIDNVQGPGLSGIHGEEGKRSPHTHATFLFSHSGSRFTHISPLSHSQIIQGQENGTGPEDSKYRRTWSETS